MPIKEHFLSLKSEIDRELELFFDSKIKQIKNQKRPDELLEMTESLKDFVLRSGKRIRPILFYYGYTFAGGKDKEKVLKAAISIELIHSFLLIHDDIIDQDNFRHGDLSMHCRYKKRRENKNFKHFEISMAIIVGDLACSFGYEILSESDFLPDLKIKAIDKMNRIVSNTIAGEAADVVLSANPDFDANKIIEMQEYKTAKYTIEGPLHLGAILAGANNGFLRSLGKFAIPLGVAFQIQDDIIGIFGDEKKIGKPVGSDIKEGKKTLLISKALKAADEKQKNIILSALGNKEMTFGDLENVRKIVKETGSLEYSKAQIKKLKEFSKNSLKEIELPGGCRKFLADLADFIVKEEY